MFWSRLGLIGLTVLWLAASTARAQTDLPLDPVAPDQTKPTETGLFLEIPSVYGAAKYDQKVNEAQAAVIITAEQIRKYGYRNFAQILDSAPGLFTNNDRNYGYLGFRGFNRPGDYTSRVLLLIDNHRLNDAVFDQGGSGTEMPIDVDLIDRIEIIKGPGSSLYGTNAFFGVVNVITKRGRDIKGAEVSGEASSFNTYRSRLSYGNKFSNGVEMLVSGSFSAPAAPGGRVLLVEDNPVNREVATGLLALLGYHVDSAEDGQQAIEVSAADAYDVILMDCQMPVMDGFTATATIRERERQTQAARIPIIALTANAMEGDRDRCLAAGMDDYLSKPFSQQSLSEILARWCWPRDQSHPKAHASRTNEKTEAGEGGTSHTPQSPSPAQINRNAWAAIATLQRPGQPNVLHNIIGLYLTSSQTQIDALRQALREQNHDAMMALAHSLKSASATLGAHRLAALANELEQACRTEHGERAEGLIPRIEIEHRDACVIFRTELEPPPKEAA